jgi:dipeptidyl aminopeptidase/acylaminoacyl peptidase
VERVVALAGLSDLTAAQEQGLGGKAVQRFLGDAPAATASPIEQVPLRARVVLAHCADDTVVPIGQSRRYVRAAAAAGGDAELLTLDEGNHMSLIEPENGWEVVADKVFG